MATANTIKKVKYPTQIGVGGLKLSEYEKQLVNEVLTSNQLTYGPFSKQFENEFAERHGCRFGLFMNSGTSALHVAVAALKSRHRWADGDEILVPSVTFVATANIVIHNKLTPVFVDVEPDTYNIDPTKIEEKLTSRTRGILPVHLLGLPADMDPILNIARRRALSIVEDSAECMFADYNGRSVGCIGDVGCFSTYVAHFLVTGVGGFATTNDPELADDMRSFMNHGRDTSYISSQDDAGAEGDELNRIVSARCSFLHIGHSFRCTEMEAALGIGQLARSVEIVARRQEIAHRLTCGLSDLSEFIQLPTCPPNRTHTYMLYGLVAKMEDKQRLINYLESRNIETRNLLPLINQPIFRSLYGNLDPQYPIAARLNRDGFYIGCHSYMTDKEVSFVLEAFHDYANEFWR